MGYHLYEREISDETSPSNERAIRSGSPDSVILNVVGTPSPKVIDFDCALDNEWSI